MILLIKNRGNQFSRSHSKNRIFYLLFFLILFALVESFQGTNAAGIIQASSLGYWPTDNWLTSTPEEQGMDSTELNELSEYIETHYSSTIDSLIIIRNGYIVYEEYPSGFNPEKLHVLHSVTKSFVSALIGIAIQRGFINNVSQKVVDFFPDRLITNLTSLKQAMTLEHLLTMTTGFQWDEWKYPYTDSRNDERRAENSKDYVQYMLDLPMESAPGTVWTYCSGASHLLSAIVEEVSNQSSLDFAFDYLFDPLGITTVSWQFDSQGIYFGGSTLKLKPLDMAKFGLLYLHNGTWDEQQILPIEWVRKSSSTSYHPFSDEYTGYGYQWWTWPFLGDVYYAAGSFGQKIISVPEHDLVIVFTADIHEEADIEPVLLYHFILPSVIDETKLAFQLDQKMLIPLFGLTLTILPTIVFLMYLRKVRKYYHSLSAKNHERV